MAIDVGDPAPDFTAKSADGDEVGDFRLSDATGDGPIVLAFFPAAFTGVCTEENCTLTDDLSVYDELGATVYGVSVDLPFTLNRFIGSEGLEHTLLSDFNKEAIEAYGVAYEDFLGLRGVAKRSLFIVDDDGTVRYAWVSEDPANLPDFDEVKETLRSLS